MFCKFCLPKTVCLPVCDLSVPHHQTFLAPYIVYITISYVNGIEYKCIFRHNLFHIIIFVTVRLNPISKGDKVNWIEFRYTMNENIQSIAWLLTALFMEIAFPNIPFHMYVTFPCFPLRHNQNEFRIHFSESIPSNYLLSLISALL